MHIFHIHTHIRVPSYSIHTSVLEPDLCPIGIELRWEVSNIAESDQAHIPCGCDTQMGDGAIIERESKPCFWRQLESTERKEADHVPMAHNDLILVTLRHQRRAPLPTA